MSETNNNVRQFLPLPACGAKDHEDCGIKLILERLGERWTIIVLSELSSGPRRYRDLEKSVEGISQRMMTLTLRRLERDGYIHRHVKANVPPIVSYELSDLGRSFCDLIVKVSSWSNEHKDHITSSRSEYDAMENDNKILGNWV